MSLNTAEDCIEFVKTHSDLLDDICCSLQWIQQVNEWNLDRIKKEKKESELNKDKKCEMCGIKWKPVEGNKFTESNCSTHCFSCFVKEVIKRSH
jgi:hypothetical protein